MKIAVMADIHGNYEALQTCTQYALKKGAEEFIFLGDYLGELAFPQRTMKFLYALKDACPCVFIRGNKEDYWLKYQNDGKWKAQDSTTGCLYYVYHNLTERDIEVFSKLEMTKVLRFSAMEPITLCHGSPRRINEGLYPEQKNTYEIMEGGTRLILCGHTHVQSKIAHKDRCILNPGSVGVPLLSGGLAQFMLLQEEGNLWKEEFVSLPYDVEKEIENLHHSGLDAAAPYWCRITEHVLRTGKYNHGDVLQKAMEYCREEKGECIWPNIPESVWKRAYEFYFGGECVLRQAVPVRFGDRIS